MNSMALWVRTRPGSDPAQALLAAGGRVDAKRWDDARSWRSGLVGVDAIVLEADLDQDGTIDAVFARGNLAGPFVAGFSPSGDLLWSTNDVTGPVSSGLRVVDLDGDGILDLYVTPGSRFGTNQRFSAFRFPNGLASGELMYTRDIERDYIAGINDVIGEFDGTPGLEIVAEGRNFLYVYDAATGNLESTSADFGPMPFGRARLRPVDVDGDGTLEIMAYSNEAWAAPNNSRHVTLFGWSDIDAALVIRWRHEVVDAANDRISFADDSVVDIDGDGQYEVVFGVYSHTSTSWETQFRDAATGALLTTIAGERFEAVTAPTPALNGLVFTHDQDEPLKAYEFDRTTGISLRATLADQSIAFCRAQPKTLSQRERMLPCRVGAGGVAGGGLVLRRSVDVSDRTVAVDTIDLNQSTLPVIGSFDAGDDFIASQAQIRSGTGALAVALTSGVVIPLDGQLRELVPSGDDVGFRGILFGSMFSGRDVPPFPLVARAENSERVLAFAGGGRALFLDPSRNASVGGGVVELWTAFNAVRAVIDDDAGYAVLFDPLRGVRAVGTDDGQTAWRVDGTLSIEDGVILHLDPLLVDVSGDKQVWFHRRDTNRGAYDLTGLSTSTGELSLFQPDLQLNNSGWKRMSMATFNGQPTPLSGPLDEVWRYDISDGAVLGTSSVESSTMTVAVPGTGDPPLLLVHGRFSLSLANTIGETLWSVPHANSSGVRFGALLPMNGTPTYGATNSATPNLQIFDLATGNIVTDVLLVGGEVVTELPESPPSLSNVTAIDDLTGNGDPAFLVGSSDGWIYAVSAADGTLHWSLDAKAPIGEIVPADWDGDGELELVASAADGTLIGIDSYTGDAPNWVHDTDGESDDDIDELLTYDTLYASWQEVPGATGYEVAVFRNDGTPVTDGFAPVGDVTNAVLEELDLESGVRYVVSVRAISALGTSPDMPSDGVTVIKTAAPTSPTGGCCDTAGGEDQSPWTETMVMLLLYVIWWRRSRAPEHVAE